MTRSSYRALFGRAIAAVLLVSVSCLTTMAAPTAIPPYKIPAIKAMLFFDTNGTFSRDILAAPDFALWNTIIGEGDAGAPSNSTFVQVEVSAELAKDTPLPHRQLVFTAIAAGKILLRRTSEFSAFSSEGKLYVGYWLYDTGCEPVKISVRILGQAKPSVMNAKIPFSCGE
jgi:hypothetical protein